VEEMSLYESLRVYHSVEVDNYLDLLRNNYGAQPHPQQPESFIIGQPPLPFFKPTRQEDYFSILSFNYRPLSIALIQALVDHPEIVPPTTRVLWTAEQDLIYEGKLRNLARRLEIKQVQRRKK
jgi:hypothetical protein